jgi:hypothetical protein
MVAGVRVARTGRRMGELDGAKEGGCSLGGLENMSVTGQWYDEAKLVTCVWSDSHGG